MSFNSFSSYNKNEKLRFENFHISYVFSRDDSALSHRSREPISATTCSVVKSLTETHI